MHSLFPRPHISMGDQCATTDGSGVGPTVQRAFRVTGVQGRLLPDLGLTLTILAGHGDRTVTPKAAIALNNDPLYQLRYRDSQCKGTN